ncbi:MAG TPA: hypothetical protein PK239_15710 [Chitinophagales bacterium]|nr:hypothetical protein [Chitinophagales bacterium]
MVHYKLSTDFSKYSDDGLSSLTGEVINALTGNAHYPTTSPTLAAITLLKEEFDTAKFKAADGGKTLTAIKNEKRKALEQGLRLLGSYVEDHGNNNLPILESTGFVVYSTDKKPLPPAPTPTDLQLFDGRTTGTVRAKVKAIGKNTLYELRYAVGETYNPDARWVYLPTVTKSTQYITGLTHGTTIWVQIRSINTKGTSNWCDPATWLVR